MISVFKDDFSGLQVGAFPYNYSPLLEYHMYIPKGTMGNWNYGTNHPSWRRKEVGAWTVLIEGNEQHKVLEQGTTQDRGLPALTAGNVNWTDVELFCSFKPLSIKGPVAVLFRYQTSRQHYAFRYTGTKIQLIKNDDVDSVILCEKGCKLSCDDYHLLKVTAVDNELKATISGLELSAKDSSFQKGKIGLAANAPVRYGLVEVKMEKPKFAAFLENERQKEISVSKKRRLMPQPVLWKKIDTPGFGAGKSVRFGDLNGDGRLEILLVQNVRRMNKDGFCEISCVTAIDMDGRLLWQVGEPNLENALVTNDLPIQIHDIDSDGKQEVILCKDFEILVLDGETGKLKYSAPTPLSPEGNDSQGFYRVNVDALYFCDLTGTGIDNDIILKDRYTNLWAYTWDLKPLWHGIGGKVGHYPMAYDVDGDEKDEILMGYNLFDNDGRLIWKLDLTDHADAVAVGKFGNSNETQIIIAASDEGMVWVSLDGEIVKHHRPGHCQTVTIGNFIHDRKGLEVATVTFWGNPGIVLVYDEVGNMITRKELIAPWSSALSPINWLGNGQEHILLSTHPEHGGLIDGYGDRVLEFPNDGHPFLCCEPIDLTGDSRDEIITWDENSMWIYTSEPVDTLVEGEVFRAQRQPHYNMSNYRAQLSLPEIKTKPGKNTKSPCIGHLHPKQQN